MSSVSKSMLKARMLEYFRRVQQTGEELVVTDNGKPVLKVVAIRAPRTIRELFADVRRPGGVVYHEDILTPTEGEWSEP